ncbi:hypothetical protein FNV43_RR21285 [Rhamnella rubrinervis]|uniref:Uncharacterized protein n=1 Tax=Rhamnella rubrinervis TaxID=2594499 RepID=A0A8K0GV96_9ROSA|nr:hypothetical protein FNV43_RR21285 [Rhamnella rubrinervis]
MASSIGYQQYTMLRFLLLMPHHGLARVYQHGSGVSSMGYQQAKATRPWHFMSSVVHRRYTQAKAQCAVGCPTMMLSINGTLCLAHVALAQYATGGQSTTHHDMIV